MFGFDDEVIGPKDPFSIQKHEQFITFQKRAKTMIPNKTQWQFQCLDH